jgi:DNA-binding NarL/FixJ family response regulator
MAPGGGTLVSVPSTKVIRVVLADDDPGFLDALATAMETDGRFEIVGLAGNGTEAFELGCWQDPDVVVMDVNMPLLGGIEAARLLRQRKPGSRVLLVSSEAPEVVAYGATGVADRIMPKADLFEVLESAAWLAGARRE